MWREKGWTKGSHKVEGISAECCLVFKTNFVRCCLFSSVNTILQLISELSYCCDVHACAGISGLSKVYTSILHVKCYVMSFGKNRCSINKN